jgi:hypothetical protein
VLSQRNPLAIDHHHPLCTVAPLGLSDSSAPFFAEAKLPSIKASLQSSSPFRFNSPRNERQIVSQTPSSSQSRNRRRHVAEDGYSAGRSFTWPHCGQSTKCLQVLGGYPPRDALPACSCATLEAKALCFSTAICQYRAASWHFRFLLPPYRPIPTPPTSPSLDPESGYETASRNLLK